MDIKERAKKITCILCDVDGTLTDGSLLVVNENLKGRVFCIRDGLGIRMWKKLGFKFGFISGDDSEATRERARMLGVDYLYLNSFNKNNALIEILEKSSLKADEIAFLGDDIIDIPLLKKVGLACAVADASEDLNECIHYKTKANGGKGAARELIELILKAKGLWLEAKEGFCKD